jgi:pimeloyl-ACP methyl ester carboxylesterase
MNFKEQFVMNSNVKLHYLDTENYDINLTPLVYVPGAMNFAEQFVDVLKFFAPRRCLPLSLRGRGKSDAPSIGYSLDHHVSDIEGVVRNSKVENYCLMAYSMGVPYAIRYASMYPDQLKGLILCDYPAKYPFIPESWPERIFSTGHIKEERHHVVTGIQRESQEILLGQKLEKINCPVLILKGGTKHSLLKNDDVEIYVRHLKHVIVEVLSNSGHELWIPDSTKFIDTIRKFLDSLDKRY